ncbi:MAG: ABC transporter ATP-binding protein [Brooklawnia sp.]|jgi:ABC-type multidrug transport system fused ATPase/permease subunit
MNDNHRLTLAGWLLRHTRRLLAPLWVSVLARIANQLLGVALLTVAARAIVRVASGQQVAVPTLVGWLVGLALAKAALRYLEHYAGHWVAFTALQRLRELLFARLIPQAPAATQGRAGAELTERATSDIDRIEVFFAHTMPPAISAVVVPAVALSWLGVTTSGLLATVLALFVAVAVVLPLIAGGATWRAAREIAARRGALAAHLGDDLQGVREVLGFGIQDARLEGLDRADRALRAARSRAGVIEGARATLAATVQAGALIALVLVAATTAISAAQLVVALAIAVGLWSPTRGIDDFAAGLDAAFAAAARIRQVIEAPPRVSDPSSSRQPPARGATLGVELAEVTFRYPGTATAVLQGVSVDFAPGTWTHVIGVSGGGKSTLAALLVRGWDPDAGQIRLDGIPLTELELDALRLRVVLVSQRPTLLTGTVAQNLRLARPDAPDEDPYSALRGAVLDEWLAGLPDGLRTRVSERGLDVSGGQLQRLALARAVVADPDVLVLDEALSQLDADTAKLVRTRLAADRPGRTIIEITHRVDLIPDDAPVVVLDGGRVLQQGPAGLLRTSRQDAFSRLEARV